LHPAGLL
jgi:hypothetical protein